jgi:predicted DNA-binding transcriptional regulator AlpA
MAVSTGDEEMAKTGPASLTSEAPVLRIGEAPSHEDLVLDQAELCRILKCSRITLHRFRRDGWVPEPLPIQHKKLIWSRDVIRNWLIAGCPRCSKPGSTRRYSVRRKGGAGTATERDSVVAPPLGEAATPDGAGDERMS